jgi:hypothetical protein
MTSTTTTTTTPTATTNLVEIDGDLGSHDGPPHLRLPPPQLVHLLLLRLLLERHAVEQHLLLQRVARLARHALRVVLHPAE